MSTDDKITSQIIRSKHENDPYTLIFFHGYGSSANEMHDYLSQSFAEALPHFDIYFANAPLSTSFNDAARSWFYIEDALNGPADGNVMAPRALSAMPIIHEYIDNVLIAQNIDESRLILAGFSQGATMAFYAALQRSEPVLGVCSISGGALDQIKHIKSKPAVILLAGEIEHSLYSGREQAYKTHALLTENGFNAELSLSPGNEHSIDAYSIQKLISFINKQSSPQVNPPAFKL